MAEAAAPPPAPHAAAPPLTLEQFQRCAKDPLVIASDMGAEARAEGVEAALAAAERHAGDPERCARAAKEAMDRRFGGAWLAVAGRDFAYEVTHAPEAHLCVYVHGVFIVLWKMF